MTDETQNAIAIAVLQEQIGGLREQQKAHAQETKIRFDQTDGKIDEILTVINKGKGAYTASMIFAGSIGALLLAGFSWMLGLFNR